MKEKMEKLNRPYATEIRKLAQKFKESRFARFYKPLPKISAWYWIWYIVLAAMLSIGVAAAFGPLSLALIAFLPALMLFCTVHILIIKYKRWNNIMSPFAASFVVYYVPAGLIWGYRMCRDLARNASWSDITSSAVIVISAMLVECAAVAYLLFAYKQLYEHAQELTEDRERLHNYARGLTEAPSTIGNKDD